MMVFVLYEIGFCFVEKLDTVVLLFSGFSCAIEFFVLENCRF